jgi:RimJ/RimL family protein N-acetyltransferase
MSLTREDNTPSAGLNKAGLSQKQLGPLAGVTLERLIPGHEAGLRAAADHPDIWTWFPRRGDGANFDTLWRFLQHEQRARRWVPYTVKIGAEIVGMTCFMAIVPEHARVEIGGTWYRPDAQGQRTNPASKHLMLSQAFSAGAERVEFKTDARNGRSRAALKKLGALEEGVLRRHQRRPDGSLRDSVYFSILAEEWGFVRETLTLRLSDR